MTALATWTEEDFDHQLHRTAEPALIDFWAEGCGPCTALAPVLEQIASEYTGRLRVAAVRLDNAPALASRFHIMALPTLILFVDGREAHRITDVATKAGLLDQLARFLPRHAPERPDPRSPRGASAGNRDAHRPLGRRVRRRPGGAGGRTR